MAPTKKKRRRKHRGTQGGKIDTRPKRPRNRAEAKQRAQARKSGGGSRKRTAASGASGARTVAPPTWRSAIQKGLVAALIFFILIAIVFGRGIGPAAGLAAFMVLFYIPMAYYTDRFFYNRQLRKQQQERAKAQQGG